MDGGVKLIDAALLNLEKLSWIYADGDKWMARPDLMKHRWWLFPRFFRPAQPISCANCISLENHFIEKYRNGNHAKDKNNRSAENCASPSQSKKRPPKHLHKQFCPAAYKLIVWILLAHDFRFWINSWIPSQTKAQTRTTTIFNHVSKFIWREMPKPMVTPMKPPHEYHLFLSMLKSCHIRATSNSIKWISMVGFGVRFGRIVRQSFRFTRDYADLRSGFSFAGVAQW